LLFVSTSIADQVANTDQVNPNTEKNIMKRILTYTLFIGAIAMLFSSCTMREKAIPLAPMNVQVEFTMDDLEYIGDVTGSTTQSYVFGVIPYGGRQYHRGTLINQGAIGGIQLPRTRGYNNALYDALQEQPDADFLIPISFEKTTEQQFLGRVETLSIKAKAFRIKSK